MSESEISSESEPNETPSMIETVAQEQYDTMTDEKAREFGRELLRLSDGLKFDHNRGQIVIGDCAVQLSLMPEGVDGPWRNEFSLEPLDETAEAWYLHDYEAVLELSWEKRGEDDE